MTIYKYHIRFSNVRIARRVGGRKRQYHSLPFAQLPIASEAEIPQVNQSQNATTDNAPSPMEESQEIVSPIIRGARQLEEGSFKISSTPITSSTKLWVIAKHDQGMEYTWIENVDEFDIFRCDKCYEKSQMKIAKSKCFVKVIDGKVVVFESKHLRRCQPYTLNFNSLLQ